MKTITVELLPMGINISKSVKREFFDERTARSFFNQLSDENNLGTDESTSKDIERGGIGFDYRLIITESEKKLSYRAMKKLSMKPFKEGEYYGITAMRKNNECSKRIDSIKI